MLETKVFEPAIGGTQIFRHHSQLSMATVENGVLRIVTIEHDGSENEYCWPAKAWGRYSIEVCDVR